MMSAQAQGWQRVSEYLHYIWKFGTCLLQTQLLYLSEWHDVDAY